MNNSSCECMFPYELEQKIAQASIAFVPLGTLEWHGWHLVLGNDAIKAHAICLQVAEKTGGVVLPPLYFGTDQVALLGSDCFIGMDVFAGKKLPGSCYYLTLDLFYMLIKQVSENLIRQGFKTIVFLTGHYPPQQRKIIQQVAREMEFKQQVKILALAEFELVKDLGYSGDHAGEWETSILLALEPQMVNLNEITKHIPLGDHLLGVDGEPEKASAATGGWILQAIVDRLTERVNQVHQRQE